MGFSVSGAFSSVVDSFMGDFGKLKDEDDKATSEKDKLYTKYYDDAKDGDTDKIPTSALKNMANDPNCSADAREKINKALESRGEEPIVSEEENDKMYEKYYDKAKDGDTEKIPTSALKNMANDPDCSDDAREKINKELEKRNEEPVLSEKDNDKLYDGYYDDAKDGDTKKIPTTALKNMANDPKCSDDARENINKELEKRNEEPVLSEKDNDKLYEGYYDDAKDGDTKKIPTSALQNMASDPKCSDDAREKINKELEKRNEEPVFA